MGYDFTGSDRTVDTHIKTLRENIRPYDTFIVTVWGFGYKFVLKPVPAKRILSESIRTFPRLRRSISRNT
jgi:DNA-binding winged helix-turn-helix (wHTH) protein